MSVSPTVTTLMKERDIYKSKITSAVNLMTAGEGFVRNTFLAQKDLVKKWLATINLLDEQILDTFIENDVAEEALYNESDEEALFNLRILRDLSVCEDKYSSSTESHSCEGGNVSLRKSKPPVSIEKPATLENVSVVTRNDKFSCKELGVCAVCTDPYHSVANCADIQGDCKSRTHVGALWPGGVKPSLETEAGYHDIGGSN